MPHLEILSQFAYFGIAGIQLYGLYKLLTILRNANRTRSWFYIYSVTAVLINLMTILRVIGALSGLLHPLTFTFRATTDPFRAACNAYLIVYWLGGVAVYLYRARKFYYEKQEQRAKLRRLGFFH